MRTVVVVFIPPSLDPDPGVGHGQEPGGVQAFAAQARVEGFDKALSVGFPGLEKSSSTLFR